MAHLIEPGMVLVGDDARDFLVDLKYPKETKEQIDIDIFKEAVNFYQEHPF